MKIYLQKFLCDISARNCIAIKLWMPPCDDKNISQIIILIKYINTKSSKMEQENMKKS